MTMWLVPAFAYKAFRFPLPEFLFNLSDLMIDVDYGRSVDTPGEVVANLWVRFSDSNYKCYIAQYIFPADAENLESVKSGVVDLLADDQEAMQNISDYLESIEDE